MGPGKASAERKPGELKRCPGARNFACLEQGTVEEEVEPALGHSVAAHGAGSCGLATAGETEAEPGQRPDLRRPRVMTR